MSFSDGNVSREAYDIHQSIQWRIRIHLLGEPRSQTLGCSGVGHILDIVAYDRADISDLLDNISQVVNNELDRRAPLSNGTEKAVYFTNYIVNQARDVIQGVDE